MFSLVAKHRILRAVFYSEAEGCTVDIFSYGEKSKIPGGSETINFWLSGFGA
jgi:hypothetical protein